MMTRSAEPLDGVNVRQVTVPGATLAVAELGAGTPIVFVPGYTGSKEDFGPLFKPLAAQGFRMLAYDQRGQYESTSTEPEGGSFTPDALAEDLLALIDVLAIERVKIVGHSYGGHVARAALLARPDVFDSIVLMSSGPGAPPPAAADPMRALRSVLLEHGVAGVWPHVNRSGLASTFARDRFLRQPLAALLGMGDGLLRERDRTGELRALCRRHDIAMLVLAGCADDVWPLDVQQAMATALGASFAAIPDAAHSPAVESPGLTAAALIEFYSRCLTPNLPCA